MSRYVVQVDEKNDEARAVPTNQPRELGSLEMRNYPRLEDEFRSRQRDLF